MEHHVNIVWNMLAYVVDGLGSREVMLFQLNVVGHKLSYRRTYIQLRVKSAEVS